MREGRGGRGGERGERERESLVEMASNLEAMASNLLAMASTLVAMAFNLIKRERERNGPASICICLRKAEGLAGSVSLEEHTWLLLVFVASAYRSSTRTPRQKETVSSCFSISSLSDGRTCMPVCSHFIRNSYGIH